MCAAALRSLSARGVDTAEELLVSLISPRRTDGARAVASRLLEPGLLSWQGPGAETRAVALGLSRREARRLRWCATLLGRLESETWAMPSPITCPEDVLGHVADIRMATREQVVAIYLDARNRPVGREVVAVGGLRASVLQPRDVLAPALLLPASGLILVHNHPSGDTRPSEEDLRVTRQLAAAARLLGLELLDHLVISRQGFSSLKEIGEL